MLDDFELFSSLRLLVVLYLLFDVGIVGVDTLGDLSFRRFEVHSEFLSSLLFPHFEKQIGLVCIVPVSLNCGCWVVLVSRILQKFLLLDKVDDLHIVNAENRILFQQLGALRQ